MLGTEAPVIGTSSSDQDSGLRPGQGTSLRIHRPKYSYQHDFKVYSLRYLILYGNIGNIGP